MQNAMHQYFQQFRTVRITLFAVVKSYMHSLLYPNHHHCKNSQRAKLYISLSFQINGLLNSLSSHLIDFPVIPIAQKINKSAIHILIDSH